MAILIKGLYLMLLLHPIMLVFVTFVPEPMFKIQKKILDKATPESSDDGNKLLINSSVVWASIWCILYFLISLIESI